MATGFFRWSRTPASNASATYTWAEGMAPSAVNDSARGIMSDAAQWRDDISGAITTGGSSTAFTVTTYSTFDTLANMAGNLVAFTPHTANGAAPTLNVDGLGAKPLRPSTGVELGSNVLLAGTPYFALYNNSDAVWYLHGMGSNAYGIPLAGGIDFWGSTTPGSAFAFPIGQAISRTTYAALFSLISTTYGVGDGTTTFNLPDKTGRASVMKEASATRLTSSYFGGDSTALGAVGGSESHTLTTAQLASHTHANSLTDPGHIHTLQAGSSGGGSIVTQGLGSSATIQPINSNTTGITITNASAGSGSAHNNVQPSIVCNYIMRIL
jgi:microcystin-dependent protein